MKHNAAVLMISGRREILPKTLDLFYNNWNNKYNYPVFIYDIDDVYSKKDISFYETKYSNLKLIKIIPKIPSGIKDEELFYNRKYNRYVKKKFDKRRLGYLHMIYFKSNMSLFGEWKCENKYLAKYDYLMIIDDDSWFKEKIEFDLFDKLNEFPLATAVSGIYKDKNLSKTREKLLKFIKSYVDKEKVDVKNRKLRDILKFEDDDLLTDLTYSVGNLDLFNLKIFRSEKYKKYIKSVNDFGGQYKYRWGDIEITNLFVHMYYKKGIYSYDLPDEIYGAKIPDVKPVYYWGKKNHFLRIFSKITNLFNFKKY